MSKKADYKQNNVAHGFQIVKTVGEYSEYILKSNGLRVIHRPLNSEGVVTSNLTYLVGSADEKRGETGLAHMLEHMLFKPTKKDLKKKSDSAAMVFEREAGINLNANTSVERTTYYFNYPKSYFERAIAIEAERMTEVVLADNEFLPERANVLSEFNMVMGDPEYALYVNMIGTALHSSPYGHGVIGYKEDIEDYTTEKLESFYRQYYRPDNAVYTIVGDIEIDEVLKTISKYFSKIKNPSTPIYKNLAREPIQEGLRRVEVRRPSNQNLLAFGFLHNGFPSKDWYVSFVATSCLTNGNNSILHKVLVDSGIASEVESYTNETKGINLGFVNVRLGPDSKHEQIEKLVFNTVNSIEEKELDKLKQKVVADHLTKKALSDTSSLELALSLTEYVSANSWEAFINESMVIKSITTKEVQEEIKRIFMPNKMTIGHFIGHN